MTRNWKQVNNKYRNEGYLYLSFGFIESWKSEMKDLNYRKRGGQFKYPNSLIQYCSVLKAVFGIGFRQIDGFTKALIQWLPISESPDYTTISRRFNKLGLDLISSLKNIDEGQIIAIDSTGIKLFQSGEWIREKHNKRKPFLKLHVAVNVKTKQATAQIMTEDSVGDINMSNELVKQAQKSASVIKVLEDGAYDSYQNYIDAKRLGFELIVKPRKGSIGNGLNDRAKTVRRIRAIGEENWKKEVQYGRRWLVEIWYSVFKRRFGEHCFCRKPENIEQELLFKTILCNQMIA